MWEPLILTNKSPLENHSQHYCYLKRMVFAKWKSQTIVYTPIAISYFHQCDSLWKNFYKMLILILIIIMVIKGDIHAFRIIQWVWILKVSRRHQQLMKQYLKYSLMIPDEFLIVPPTGTKQRDLLELMESRCSISTTIIYSQFHPE